MRGAHPERALERRVAERLGMRAGETILVAVSGGGDSVALAALAQKAALARDARIVLGHVNHGTRASAWQDEAVALALASALGARVLTAHPVVAGDDEARLREARYAALADLARRAAASRIVSAHHAEDQSESVLLALFRGAGVDGLLGIAPARDLGEGLVLERPLLDVPKAALAAYAAARNLPVAVDPTNASLGYRRNAVRAALAELREPFPNLDEAVARAATILRQEREGTPRAGLRRALRRAVGSEGGGTHDLTFERLEAAARALEGNVAGRHFLRPGVELVIGSPRSGGNDLERSAANAEKHRTA